VLADLTLSQGFGRLGFDYSGNFDYPFNLNDFLHLYILGHFYVFLDWNFNPDLNNLLYRNLNNLLLVDWLFNDFLNLDDLFNYLFNWNLHESFLDNLYLYLFVDIDWNFNYFFYRNFYLNILIDFDIYILGYLNFSNYSLFIRNLNLLYYLNWFLNDPFNRDLNDSVYKDWYVNVLVDDFLNIFLNRIRNLYISLNRDFLDPIYMDLFVSINSHRYLLISLYNLLYSNRFFNYFVNIDFLLHYNFLRYFDDFLKLDFLLNLYYSWYLDYHILILVNRNIND
jgi:hypothetical protein